MSYSYLYQQKYFYMEEILEIIEKIKIERSARKDNKDLIATTFAEDLKLALREA